MHKTVRRIVVLVALLMPLSVWAQDDDSEDQASVSLDQLLQLSVSDYLDQPEIFFTGPVTDFYANGQKKLEASFVRGKPVGVMTTWYENGQKETEAMFVNGVREGPFTMWHENGQKKAHGNWVNNKLDGPWAVWHENGQMAFEGSFQSGRRLPGSHRWDEDGNTIVHPE